MNKVVLAMLPLAALPARAEWLRIVETTTSTVVYVDSQTTGRSGDIRKVSELHDHKIPLSNFNLSTRFLSEYNCTGKLVRRLQVDEFSEHMAQGRSRSTPVGKEQPWSSVLPDTATEAVMKFVCDH